ncbi:MAG: phosphatase PAP2 family protein [Caldilineaceae bacterium]
MKRRIVLGRSVGLLLVFALAFVQSVSPALAMGLSPAPIAAMDDTTTGIEPDASRWGTWALASADELRPDAPPDAAATAAEMEELLALVAERDAEALALVKYWDAGAPGYRWLEMTSDAYRAFPLSLWPVRAHALVTVAMYDATIAAWDAKYAYNRPRPADFDPSFSPLIPTPDSPSYVSEYAAVAGAASTVLAYLFPDSAEMYAAAAEEAGRSRLLAGVEYPSDVAAGLALGRAVGERVVAIAQADGSDAKWDGTRPAGPGILTNENPVFPMSGTWRTWTLAANDQFRSPPPPAYDSAETQTELAELKAITRTVPIIARANAWNVYDSGYLVWFQTINTRLFEANLDRNPPQAALAYSAVAVASYDAMVACFDSKYAYWRIRPNQLDPTLTTIVPTPPHPSYPAAHSCSSSSVTAVMADLFPANAAAILAMGEEAGQSRIWAGIHFRSDIDAGTALGQSVGQGVLERVAEMKAGDRYAGIPRFGSKSWKIANAMTGGPYAIAKNALILDWPEGDAEPAVLRSGTNGWVCRPDLPATPTNDPRCLDQNWIRLFTTPLGAERDALDLLGFGYMLQHGDAADNHDISVYEPAPGTEWVLDGPHLMINSSGGFEEEYFVEPNPDTPYVMFPDSQFEHLMLPTPIDQVMPSVNPIWDAMSAAPLRVSAHAAVWNWPSEASAGAFEELRAGTNGWTCLADDPGTPTHDPMCVDANFMEFINAIVEGRDPVYVGVGIAYMLQGGSGASATDYTATAPPAGEDWMIDPPHVMVVVPWDLDPADYATDPASGGPWIMWEGSPYEHLMVPVNVMPSD